MRTLRARQEVRPKCREGTTKTGENGRETRTLEKAYNGEIVENVAGLDSLVFGPLLKPQALEAFQTAVLPQKRRGSHQSSQGVGASNLQRMTAARLLSNDQVTGAELFGRVELLLRVKGVRFHIFSSKPSLDLIYSNFSHNQTKHTLVLSESLWSGSLSVEMFHSLSLDFKAL